VEQTRSFWSKTTFLQNIRIDEYTGNNFSLLLTLMITNRVLRKTESLITLHQFNSSCQFKIKRGYRKTRYILYKETLVDFKENFGRFLVLTGIIVPTCNQKLSHSDVVYLIGSFGASVS
jgi:hypothetical protein